MGASGSGTIDFGAFPGSSDATATVTGQTGILANSLVEAWLMPLATADHSADEHMVDTIKVIADASSIVAGTGFTVRAFNTSQINEPLLPTARGDAANTSTGPGQSPNNAPSIGGAGTRLYGQYSFGWVWQ